MKIYTGYPGGITKITNDKGFYQTEDLANVITVYVDKTNLTGITYSLTLEFLRADGRKTTIYTEDSFASGEATTLTEENVTYDIHNFTLTNTQLAVAGALAFTCYINILNSGVIEKRGVLFNAVSNVRKTVLYSANTIFVVSEDEEDVPIIVADMKTAIETLSGQLASKVNKADIADDLTTNNSSKVLSAKQGYILKTMLDALNDSKADKSDVYTKPESDATTINLAAQISKGNLYVTKMYGNLYLNVNSSTGELIYSSSITNRYVDPNWYHLQVGDKICFNGNENYRYWLAVKTNLSDNSITDTGWLQEDYTAINECYVRISVGNADDSNFTMDFVELLDEDVVLIYTKKPITTRLGSIYNDKINSYLFYSGVDVFNNRLRTNVLQFKKGDIINFKEYGTEYAWAFMGWNFDGTLDLDTGWKTSNFYVVPKDYKAVIIFKKSDYAQSLLLKGNIYYQKGLDGATNTATCVIVLDNKCVKTGDTITITKNTNAIDFKVDFLNDQWGQGTTTLQTIAYGTTSATVTADMDSVKNVVITIKKSDGTAFSNISSELLWYIYRTANITKSNGEYFDTEAIYDVDFEVNGEVEPTKFNSNLVQIGHRGWDEYAPENTIPSFDLAYKLGCRFLEGDIRFTSDGVPVMLHDATLNRTARNEDGNELSSTINIANITYAQALEYDFGIYQGDLYQGTKIPTFEEMIKWLKLHNDVYFQIDLTTGSWSNSQVLALYKIVAKYGMFDNLIWESGSSATISYLISLGVKPKNTMVSYYSSITTANVDTAYNLGCKVFSIQYSLATYSLIQYVISKGMKPYIWFDSADKYAYNVYRLTNLGVVGFYNTNISDIYALRWFKTFVGIDGNTASSITDKDTALLNQAYSDISTLEQETENLKQASLGNIMQETTYSNTNPSKSTKVVLSKVGGMSYKSENLAILHNASGGIAGIDYSASNGVISISGTSSSAGNIDFEFDELPSDTYSILIQIVSGTQSTSSKPSIYVRNASNSYVDYSDNNRRNFSFSNSFKYIRVGWNETSLSLNLSFKIMVIKGSTLPTEFKENFTGIRDSAVTSVVSKGANIFGNYTTSTTYNCNNFIFDSNQNITFTATGNDAYVGDVINTGGTYSTNLGTLYEVSPNTTYAYLFNGDFTKSYVSFLTNEKVGIRYSTLNNTSGTFTTDSNVKYILFRFGVGSSTSGNTYSSKFMIIKGSTAPSSYKPYVTPIIKTIPSQIQALDGYGWGVNDTCYNYIDFDRKVFVQNVGRVDLGTLTWTKYTITEGTMFRGEINDIATLTNGTIVANVLCANYSTVSATTRADGTCYVQSNQSAIDIIDSNYTDATAFKSALNGVYLYYELATPVETDISAYLTTDTIEVEPLGTLEFLNTYNQAVPNEIAYLFNAVTLNNIVDSNGNPRFIEGEGTPATITGFTATQCKWSLSGTHLMLVLAGTIANGTTLTNGQNLAVFTLPDFIKNKITPSWANNYIERKANVLFADNWTTQTDTVVLGKFTNINIQQSGEITLTADRHFRIQFDLLIDSD